jgi:protein-disulfide isomerase
MFQSSKVFAVFFALACLFSGLALAQDLSSNPAYTSNIGEIYNNPTSPTFGDPNGDVTIVEYFDYNCGYCKASEEGLERLMKEDKRVKVIFKDFPKLGPLSMTAASASMAAALQDSYKYEWMHNILMNKAVMLSNETIVQAATVAGLDVDRIRQDMSNPAIAAQLQKNIDIGKGIGVRVTPSFIVGPYFMPGFADYDKLKQAVAYVRAAHKAR